jgi:hypothetical protein
MEDTLKILESVEKFYAHSFSQLVTITIALVALAGIIMPILITLFQMRIFKIEHSQIKLELEKEMEVKFSSELEKYTSTLRNEYEVKESEYKSELKRVEKKSEKDTNIALGGLYLLQGNMNINNKLYISGAYSYIHSSIFHIKSDLESSLKIALNNLCNHCYPNLSKEDFKHEEELNEYHTKLINDLKEYNTNKRYSSEIKTLRIAYDDAINRKSIRQTAPIQNKA